MKIKVDNYTFNKTAKTVTFSDYSTIRLDSILLITNVTDGIIIYNFADPTKGGIVLTNVLTLAYDTSGMSDSDKLQIFYEDSTANQLVSAASLPLPTGASTSAKQDDIVGEISNKDLMEVMRNLVRAIANPGYVDKSANAIRNQIQSGTVTTVTTVTTCTTVTGVTNLGGYPAQQGIIDANRNAWANVVRRGIT